MSTQAIKVFNNKTDNSNRTPIKVGELHHLVTEISSKNIYDNKRTYLKEGILENYTGTINISLKNLADKSPSYGANIKFMRFKLSNSDKYYYLKSIVTAGHMTGYYMCVMTTDENTKWKTSSQGSIITPTNYELKDNECYMEISHSCPYDSIAYGPHIMFVINSDVNGYGSLGRHNETSNIDITIHTPYQITELNFALGNGTTYMLTSGTLTITYGDEINVLGPVDLHSETYNETVTYNISKL